MPFQVDVRKKKGYLHLSVSGDNTPATVAAYFKEAIEICRKRGERFVLVEENLSGPGLSLADMYHLVVAGVEEARGFLAGIAYVDVNPEHDAGRARFAGSVASNRGAVVQVFQSVLDAENWLMGEIRMRERKAG